MGGGHHGAARLGQPMAVDYRVAHDAAHELACADGVIVAGDDVGHDIGVAVGVHDGDQRDAQLVGLADRYVLGLGVEHEHRLGGRVHLADAA